MIRKPEPLLWRGKWIIVNKPGLMPTGNSGQRPPIPTFEACWTGERWVGQSAEAKEFPSDKDAWEYIAGKPEMETAF